MDVHPFLVAVQLLAEAVPKAAIEDIVEACTRGSLGVLGAIGIGIAAGTGHAAIGTDDGERVQRRLDLAGRRLGRRRLDVSAGKASRWAMQPACDDCRRRLWGLQNPAVGLGDVDRRQPRRLGGRAQDALGARLGVLCPAFVAGPAQVERSLLVPGDPVHLGGRHRCAEFGLM